MPAVMKPRRARLLCPPLLLAVMLLSGCSTLGYYVQAIGGHLAILQAARPVGEWLADPATPPARKARLELAMRMRAFATNDLGLKDSDSFDRFADIHRLAAVWNVAAAPVDSLTLERWCFVFVGCVGYRGYYDETAARAFADELHASEGLEVTVYGVPMYSTLGWLDWLGGDPLLSTVIDYPEGALARIVFHELAHRQVYVAGDTTFNESYAAAVGSLGMARWLALHASEAVRRAQQETDGRQSAFMALTRQARDELSAIYDRKAQDVPQARVLAEKQAALARFRARYAELKAGWAQAGRPYDGFDRWVASANNASLALQAAYDRWVPAFEALLAREGGDWPRFHAAVRALAALAPEERHARLDALMGVPGVAVELGRRAN